MLLLGSSIITRHLRTHFCITVEQCFDKVLSLVPEILDRLRTFPVLLQDSSHQKHLLRFRQMFPLGIRPFDLWVDACTHTLL